MVRDEEGNEIDRLLVAEGRGIYHVVSLPRSSRFSLRFGCSQTAPETIKNGDPRELAIKFHDIGIYPMRTAEEVVGSDCWALPDERLDGVFIELTTRCNIRCLMCPQVVGKPVRGKDMPVATIERALATALHADTIDLHGIGEPLLAPEFISVMKALPTPDGDPTTAHGPPDRRGPYPVRG